MIRLMSDNATPQISVTTGCRIADRLPDLTQFALATRPNSLSQHPAWLPVLRDGLDVEIDVMVGKRPKPEAQ